MRFDKVLMTIDVQLKAESLRNTQSSQRVVLHGCSVYEPKDGKVFIQ